MHICHVLFSARCVSGVKQQLQKRNVRFLQVYSFYSYQCLCDGTPQAEKVYDRKKRSCRNGVSRCAPGTCPIDLRFHAGLSHDSVEAHGQNHH